MMLAKNVLQGDMCYTSLKNHSFFFISMPCSFIRPANFSNLLDIRGEKTVKGSLIINNAELATEEAAIA